MTAPPGWDRIRACSHVWICDDDPPIARQPYSPIVGPGRYQMKPGQAYRCRNCDSVLTLGAVRPGDDVTAWMAASSRTYELRTVRDRTAIVCRLCDRISELAGDVDNRYCSRCHLFHDAVAEGRRLLESGGTHECGEWRTWRDRCALCGRVLEARTGGESAIAKSSEN